MNELVSKQMVIDSIMEEPSEARYPAYYAEKIKQLDPAQPQAIKDCRNCKYGNYNDHYETYFCYCPDNCSDWDKWGPSARLESGWIPVTEDNKPLICSNVLVTDFNTVLEAYYDSKGNWWDLLGTPLKWVTAWMPTPKPYKRSENV